MGPPGMAVGAGMGLQAHLSGRLAEACQACVTLAMLSPSIRSKWLHGGLCLSAPVVSCSTVSCAGSVFLLEGMGANGGVIRHLDNPMGSYRLWGWWQGTRLSSESHVCHHLQL